MHRQPIAYTYEADIHCYYCTIARFPTTEGTDHEGNPVGAIFSWDEYDTPLACGDCAYTIRD